MALRKAETETPGSSVTEARAKSTVVGTDTNLQVKGASSEPSYEALTQQIAYLMSAFTNQTPQNLNKNSESMGSSPMEMVSTHSLHSKNPKGIEKI